MHREKPLDFWLTLLAVAALFTPIWGILLLPTRAIRLPSYLLYVALPAWIILIGILIYARGHNRVMLNRFLVGYAAGFAGTFIVQIFIWSGIALGIAGDLVAVLGKLALGRPVDSPADAPALIMGYAYHFALNGCAWGAVYALVFGKANWWFGMLYGIFIWTVSVISPPFYTTSFSAAGLTQSALVIFINLVAHLGYGTAIGWVVYRYVFPEVGVEGAKAVRPTYA